MTEMSERCREWFTNTDDEEIKKANNIDTDKLQE
jgi:hypothetical protein